MRKHVTPADPAATIPDPAGGQPLPPEGRTVTWSAYWAGLEMRQDITSAVLLDEPEPAGDAAAPVVVEDAPTAAETDPHA